MKRTKPEPYEAEVSRLLRGEHRNLARLRREYGSGEPRALLTALAIVLHEGRKVPRWISEPMANAAWRVVNYQARTLDDALRLKATKGYASLKRVHSVGKDAYSLVRRAEDEGRALTDDLFNEVGDRLGIGKNTARKYFIFWRDVIAARR